MCAIDLFCKYAQVVPLKDKRRITIVNVFQKIISKGRKPNRIWVDQGGEFYNWLFNRFFKINSIEIYSTYNEGKSIVAERFIRTLKNKISKHMTTVSKNIYFDVLDDIVNKYKNTVHGKIKMKPLGLHVIPMLNTMKILTKKILNLKLLIVSEFQNTKMLLLKNTPKIGSCLKQDSVTFHHGKVVNIYIVYEIRESINISYYLTLENCFFGADTLTKNADIDKYKYSAYEIGFDRHGGFSSRGIGLGSNLIIFGEDMSSSTKIDNRKNDILILGKGPTQGLEHTLSAEKNVFN